MGGFQFQPKWKEELACSHALGKFVLEMPMGVPSVSLPTEQAWLVRGPEWAKPLWSQLHTELSAWCVANGIPLYVEEHAHVW